MRLSTKGRYATRAMLDLAIHSGEGPILIKDISRREGISKQYLEQLLTPLRAIGLVRAIRGARGGFMLARLPSQIKLIEIIQTIEGSTAPVECVDNAKICPRSDFCVTREIWSEMKRATDNVLESTTLQDLVERQKKKEQPKVGMYQI